MKVKMRNREYRILEIKGWWKIKQVFGRWQREHKKEAEQWYRTPGTGPFDKSFPTDGRQQQKRKRPTKGTKGAGGKEGPDAWRWKGPRRLAGSHGRIVARLFIPDGHTCRRQGPGHRGGCELIFEGQWCAPETETGSSGNKRYQSSVMANTLFARENWKPERLPYFSSSERRLFQTSGIILKHVYAPGTGGFAGEKVGPFRRDGGGILSSRGGPVNTRLFSAIPSRDLFRIPKAPPPFVTRRGARSVHSVRNPGRSREFLHCRRFHRENAARASLPYANVRW